MNTLICSFIVYFRFKQIAKIQLKAVNYQKKSDALYHRCRLLKQNLSTSLREYSDYRKIQHLETMAGKKHNKAIYYSDLAKAKMNQLEQLKTYLNSSNEGS